MNDSKTEMQAFDYALSEWQAFHSKTSTSNLSELLLDCECSEVVQLAELLRYLPTIERWPVAFGVYVRASKDWTAEQQDLFQAEFLRDPSWIEQDLLKMAAMGDLELSDRLPVTVEEFPSRIWKRACANATPARLVSAARQSVDAMQQLIYNYEDDNELDDYTKFRIPSGNLPNVIDLVALSPFFFRELKCQILDHLKDKILEERFQVSSEQLPAMSGWVQVDTIKGDEFVKKISRQVLDMTEEYVTDPTLYRHHHLYRLGRLMFRFSERRLVQVCAKTLGVSAWRHGWQFQPVSGNKLTSIRKAIIRSDSKAEAWMIDPALACSAMSLPLWLQDGVERLTELNQLFIKSAVCPWIFPKLKNVFQWHLALAEKNDELAKIKANFSDLAIGLSGASSVTNFNKKP